VFAGIALPLIPIVARTIGMRPAGMAVMLTMQFIGALLGVAVGHLTDRLPCMPLVIWPAIAARSLLVPLAFIRHPVGFLLFSSLFYFLANLNGPPYMSIMRSNYSDGNRGRLMGNIRIANVGTAAVCSALAAIVLLHGDAAVRWLFPSAAVAGIISAAMFARIKVRRLPPVLASKKRTSFLSSIAALRGNGRFLLFMLIFFVCTAPDKLTVPLEPIRFVDELGLDYHWAALVLGAVVSVSSMAGYFAWAKALKRTSSFTLFTVLVFLFSLRFALIAAASNRLHLLPVSIIGGLTNAGWDLLPLFCILELASPDTFAVSFGFHTTLLGVRGIVGPAIGTLLYTSSGLSTAGIFWLVSGLTASGCVAMIPFARAQGRRVRASRTASRK
jgi:MFS family permease